MRKKEIQSCNPDTERILREIREIKDLMQQIRKEIDRRSGSIGVQINGNIEAVPQSAEE